MQAPAPDTAKAIRDFDRRMMRKPRTTGRPKADDVDVEIQAAVGFKLELAGRERIHWADSPRDASEKIVKLWNLVVELKQRDRERRPDTCPSCSFIRAAGARNMNCAHCGQICGDAYAVHDEVWALTGLVKLGGSLHLRCLEKLIGRPLSLRDFKPVPMTETVRFGYDMRERELLRNGGQT